MPHPGLITLPTLRSGPAISLTIHCRFSIPRPPRPDGNGGFIRDPYPGNIIPDSQISGVAKRLIALLPAPDLPNKTFFNYVDRSSSPSSDNDWSFKLDHQLTSKQYLTGSFWRVNADTVINGPVAGELNPGLRQTPTEAIGVRFNHVWTINQSLLNRASFGLTRVIPTWATFLLDPRLGNQTLQIPGIPRRCARLYRVSLWRLGGFSAGK